MPAVRKSRRSVEEGVRAELQQIRAQVAGVRGSLVATSDGLVVAHGREVVAGRHLGRPERRAHHRQALPRPRHAVR